MQLERPLADEIAHQLRVTDPSALWSTTTIAT